LDNNGQLYGFVVIMQMYIWLQYVSNDLSELCNKGLQGHTVAVFSLAGKGIDQ